MLSMLCKIFGIINISIVFYINYFMPHTLANISDMVVGSTLGLFCLMVGLQTDDN